MTPSTTTVSLKAKDYKNPLPPSRSATRKRTPFFATPEEKKEYEYIQWLRKEIAIGEEQIAKGKCVVLENEKDIENFFDAIVEEVKRINNIKN